MIRRDGRGGEQNKTEMSSLLRETLRPWDTQKERVSFGDCGIWSILNSHFKGKGSISGRMKFVFRRWKGPIRGHNSDGLFIAVRARKSQEKTFRKLF